MRPLQIEVSTREDFKFVMRETPPEGLKISLDPASARSFRGNGIDDLSAMTFVLEHVAHIAESVAVALAIKYVEKLPAWISGRVKLNGSVVPEDLEARREKLLEMLNDRDE